MSYHSAGINTLTEILHVRHEKKRRTRWSRVVCPRKNCYGNSKSYFVLRLQSIMLVRNSSVFLLRWLFYAMVTSLALIPDLLAVHRSATHHCNIFYIHYSKRRPISGSYNECVYGVLWSYRSFGIWQVCVIIMS